MKTIAKKIIYAIMRWEAKRVLKRFKPRIIGVAGSVGKTTTKEVIYSALKDFVIIRKSRKSFNSEIGVPLTILNLETGWSNPGAWIKNMWKGFFVMFQKEYPDWLVLELGTDRPGDMKKLASWLELDYAVFTRFPDVPVHAQYFSKPQDVNDEDAQMMQALKAEGVLVLNADDEKVQKLSEKSTFKTLDYGFDGKADVCASNMEFLYTEGKVSGINIKINFQSNSVPFILSGAVGATHAYPILAALTVAKDMGLSLIEVLQSLANYRPATGRMNVLAGIANMTLIDDSYNSSPVALEEAFKTLGEIDLSPKVAVLGDMAELGKHSVSAHKKIAVQAQKYGVSHLVLLGTQVLHTAEEAKNMKGAEVKVYQASDHGDAVRQAVEWGRGGVVLIKGSQSSRMEKVTRELLADPSRASEVLVRQEKVWM